MDTGIQPRQARKIIQDAGCPFLSWGKLSMEQWNSRAQTWLWLFRLIFWGMKSLPSKTGGDFFHEALLPGSLAWSLKIINHPKRKVIFQPSFFRVELLNFGGVFLDPLLKGPFFSWLNFVGTWDPVGADVQPRAQQRAPVAKEIFLRREREINQLCNSKV